MALTLASNVSAATQNIPVSGTVPDNVGSGYRFALDDEILLLRRFGTVTRANSPAVITENRQVWVCSRAQDGSLAATHSAGASIFAVADAWTASSGLTPPDPIVTGGGGGAPAAHAASHEQGGSDEIDVTGLVGAGGAVSFVSALVTSAELLALGATPRVIVAAPGAGQAISVLQTSWFYKFNSVAYAFTSGAWLMLTTANFFADQSNGWFEHPCAGFLDATASQFVFDLPNLHGGPGAQYPSANIDGGALILQFDRTAAATLGDGTLRIDVLYTIVDLS